MTRIYADTYKGGQVELANGDRNVEAELAIFQDAEIGPDHTSVIVMLKDDAGLVASNGYTVTLLTIGTFNDNDQSFGPQETTVEATFAEAPDPECVDEDGAYALSAAAATLVAALAVALF